MKRISTLLVATLLLTGCGYNQIQTYDERVNGAQGNIEAQLQRRSDLIPNLVRVAEEAGLRENAILRDVTQARAGLQGALGRTGGRSPQELADANQQLTTALGRFNSFVVESYPQLRSNQNFLNLQDELTGTENRIAVSRTDYNGAVQEYNTYIRRFPAALTARATGAKPREFFTASAAAQAAPEVKFSRPDMQSAPAAGTTAPAAPAGGTTPR
jgi:LemA protein